MDRFDLLGPLPSARSTTVLEASAGTGKTFALAGLVTRYLADGEARLDQMLLITFGRAASQELRERVRRQIVEAVAAFDDPSTVGDNQVVAHLLDGTDEQRTARQQRLRDALSFFDAATIATTHQFCQLVLKSLGVAGDTDAGVVLVEDLNEVVAEIVDDLYLAHFGQQPDKPVLNYRDALRLAREVVENPATELRPSDPDPDSPATVRLSFARDVLAVADNMHRALETAGPELREHADAKVKALIEGVELTERELLKSLEKNGVRKFSPEGEKFDPNVHQAMYEIQNPDLPPGTVGQVIQAGYMIGERVLRPALVGVVKAPPKPTANDNPQPDNNAAN